MSYKGWSYKFLIQLLLSLMCPLPNSMLANPPLLALASPAGHHSWLSWILLLPLYRTPTSTCRRKLDWDSFYGRQQVASTMIARAISINATSCRPAQLVLQDLAPPAGGLHRYLGGHHYCKSSLMRSQFKRDSGFTPVPEILT